MIVDLLFRYLDISNFKSFVGDDHRFAFSAFPEGLCFLKGKNLLEPRISPNGASKSSVWDALCWVLYGRTAKGLRNPDILSWYTNKTARVEVVFSIGEDEITITRTASPNKLMINGEESSQDQVNGLIGMTFDTFIHTILIGQGLPLFFDLTPSDKMQLFSDVLNLHRWDERSTRASDSAREVESRLRDLDTEITKVDAEKRSVSDQLDDAKRRSKSWSNDIRSRIADLETTQEEKEKTLDSCTGKLEEASLDRDSAETELDALEKTIGELRESFYSAAKEADLKSQEIRQVSCQYKDAEVELQDLGRKDNCPTCGQPLEGTKLGEHKKKIRADIRNLGYKLDRLEQEVKKKTRARKKAEDTLNLQKAHLEKFRERAKKADSVVRHFTPIVSTLVADITNIKGNIEKLEDEPNPYYDQMFSLRKIRSKLIAQKKDLVERKKKADRKLQRTRFWIKGFKDVKLYIIDQVLDELEIATNNMLIEVGLEDWSVEYRVEKETKSGTIKRGLDVLILSPKHKEPVKWSSWSGGEGQRLRIVGALALSEVLLNYAGINTNLEILDEPTTFMPPQGVRDLCEFLSNRAHNLKRQIWYIDHHTTESSDFSAFVTVVKDSKGHSYIQT